MKPKHEWVSLDQAIDQIAKRERCSQAEAKERLIERLNSGEIPFKGTIGGQAVIGQGGELKRQPS